MTTCLTIWGNTMLSSTGLARIRELSKDNKKLNQLVSMKEAVIQQQSKTILKMRRDLDLAHAALSVEQTINSMSNNRSG